MLTACEANIAHRFVAGECLPVRTLAVASVGGQGQRSSANRGVSRLVGIGFEPA